MHFQDLPDFSSRRRVRLFGLGNPKNAIGREKRESLLHRIGGECAWETKGWARRLGKRERVRPPPSLPPAPLSSSGPKNPPSSPHLSCGWDSTIFLGRTGEAKETRMNFGQFPSPLGHSAAAAACQCLCVWERKGGVARREKSCFCQQPPPPLLGQQNLHSVGLGPLLSRQRLFSS